MRKEYITFFGFIFSVILFTGCARYSLVEPRKDIVLGNGFKVEDSQVAWSMAKNGGITVWTVDGESLEKLVFFPGIQHGMSIYKNASMGGKKLPTFSSSMTPIEIMDLVVSTLALTGAHNIEKEQLKPSSFGKLDGFKFSFSYVSEAGLRYRGFSSGTIKDQQLNLVIYMGTDLYYYDKYAAQAEKIIETIEIL